MLIVNHWWLLALRGISSVLFGIYFFVYPELTLELLFKGFCFYSLVDGAFCLLAAVFSARNKTLRWIFTVIGLISCAAAVVALFQPLIAMIALLLSVGLWAIFTGFLEIVAGFTLNAEIKGRIWLKLSGFFSLIIGTILIVQPFANFLTLALLIGIYQIFKGVVNLLMAFGIRRNRTEIEMELENSV